MGMKHKRDETYQAIFIELHLLAGELGLQVHTFEGLFAPLADGIRLPQLEQLKKAIGGMRSRIKDPKWKQGEHTGHERLESFSKKDDEPSNLRKAMGVLGLPEEKMRQIESRSD